MPPMLMSDIRHSGGDDGGHCADFSELEDMVMLSLI